MQKKHWAWLSGVLVAWYVISQPVKASASADKLIGFIGHAGNSFATFLGGVG